MKGKREREKGRKYQGKEKSREEGRKGKGRRENSKLPPLAPCPLSLVLVLVCSKSFSKILFSIQKGKGTEKGRRRGTEE